MDKATRQAQILRDLATVVRQDVPEFAPASEEDQAAITVLLTTSPMPSHPDPWVVGNVHNSIRRHLPGSRILVLADGVVGSEPETYTEFKKNAKELGKKLQTLILEIILTVGCSAIMLLWSLIISVLWLFLLLLLSPLILGQWISFGMKKITKSWFLK